MGKEWVSWIGGGNSMSYSSAKREKMESGGCMCAVLHLFHTHHRNHSNTYPFIQEQQPTTTTGLEAPRNSLEELKQEEDLKFPVSIKIKGKDNNTASECDSPGSNTPSLVARLMGLDLFPQQQCTSPSIPKSPLLLQIDVTRSLPETPRTSSSSRKSDVERHRLSLQINKENVSSPSDRLDQDDKRVRSVGLLDITNTYYHRKSKIVSKYEEREKVGVLNEFPIVKERQKHKESKKARGKCKNLPARATASRREDGSVGFREKKKSNLVVQKNCKRNLVQIRNGAAKLPQKQQSQVSNAIISWKCSTQLSSKPCTQTPTTVSPVRSGAWSEHKNYIQILLRLKAAAGISHRWERKLTFELVDELLAENLTRQLRLSRKKIYPFSDDGGCRLVEELCKKIASFPAAKCVILEDIDSLIDKDWCKEDWDEFQGEEEDTVGEIECEIVEWLVDEAVAVMGGDAAEELLFVARGLTNWATCSF